MESLINEIDSGIESLNPYSKTIFKYGIFIAALIHICAVIIFLLSNSFDNYFKMMETCDLLLKSFEIVIGIIVMSIVYEIFVRARNAQM
ncbi:MAG: hypothetical protein LBH71_00555 [Oscillospiraceae bacterium]|nr:hypothetical protein [Oscillospiraceae bacterium]